MTSRKSSWPLLRTGGWADEVDDELRSSQDLASPVYDEASNKYRSTEGAWHEDINVERGQSQQRLDLDSGFMRSIRQNQYARDDHEQAWQDAYTKAPSFQQRWGVGIKVQNQRRAEEGQWQQSQASRGVRGGEEDSGDLVNQKPWWRKAADIQHTPGVRILSRSEAQRRAMPVTQPEALPQPVEAMPQRQLREAVHEGSMPPVPHEELEAQLLQRSRPAHSDSQQDWASSASPYPTYSTSEGARRSEAQPAPLIDSQGIAMGIPVEWATDQGAPAALLRYSYSEAQSRDVLVPEQPRGPPALAPEPVESPAKLAKQEKVKMGFQLYRPPTLLAQASPEEASGQEEAQHSEQSVHRAPGEGRRPRRKPAESQDHGAAAPAKMRAGHSTAPERADPASAASASRAPGRQNARMAKHGKDQRLQHDEQVDTSSAASRRAQSLPDSPAGTERKQPARAMNGGRSDGAKPPTAKADASSKLRSARRPAAQLYQPAVLAQSEQAAKGESPAQKASPQTKRSSRRRGQPAVPDSSAQLHAEDTAVGQQALSQAKRDRLKQRADPAPGQHAGSKGSAEGSALPKKLLSELVREVQGLSVSSKKSKVPAEVPKAAQSSESTKKRSRKSRPAAPPGL